MAILSVEVPDQIARKFSPYTIVKLRDLSIEEQLLEIDWEWWETVVDFWLGVDAWDILSFLDKKNG